MWRTRYVWVGAAIVVSTLLVPAARVEAEGCPYQAGFAALKAAVGDPMGDPVTCEYPDPSGTGDVEQRTTTGLAFWRKSTNTPTFTNGSEHWGLTASGLVTWAGSSIDPPAQEGSYHGDPRAVALAQQDLPDGFYLASEDTTGLDRGLYGAWFQSNASSSAFFVETVAVAPSPAQARSDWQTAWTVLQPGWAEASVPRIGDATFAATDALDDAVGGVNSVQVYARVSNVTVGIGASDLPSALGEVQKMAARVQAQLS